MSQINVKLLTYTDLKDEIARINVIMTEAFIADETPAADAVAYLHRLNTELLSRIETGNFQDHRENA